MICGRAIEIMKLPKFKVIPCDGQPD